MANKLYAAYGSNLNLRQMSIRCPDAIPVGKAMLKGWQLTFRGVATLEPKADAETPVGIWRITPKDESALDRGISSALPKGNNGYHPKRRKS
jgi:hypothetical protein